MANYKSNKLAVFALALIASNGLAAVLGQQQPLPLQPQPQPQSQPQQQFNQSQPLNQSTTQQPLNKSQPQPSSQSNQQQLNQTQQHRPSITTTKVEVKPLIRVEPVKVIAITTQAKTTTHAPIKIVKPTDKSSNDDKGIWPMVNVEKHDNKSKTDVHIPLIFDMTNDKDIGSGKAKLDLTVLSGLVTVTKDRENGKGPLTVTIFGIPVYTGTGNSGGKGFVSKIESTLTEQRKRFDDAVENIAGSREMPSATLDMYSKVRKSNDNAMMSLSDSLSRASSFLREQTEPKLNTNGRAASKSDSFVTHPPAFKAEDLKPKLTQTAFIKFMNSNSSAHDHTIPI